jgi:DNA-binding transcriptional ArsR family regulator
MSNRGGQTGGSASQSRERSYVGADAEMVLAVLQDEECRQILSALETEARSVTELTDRLQISKSTTYRKISELTDAGLVAEKVRLQPFTRHRKEYVHIVDDVDVRVVGDSDLQVTLQLSESPSSAGSE